MNGNASRRIRGAWWFLPAVLVLWAVGTILPAQEEDVVSGEIEIAEMDDDGNVVSVYVYDWNWGDVLVANSGRGAELSAHVGELVDVHGRVEELENAEFDYLIHVTKYSLVEGDPESPDGL